VRAAQFSDLALQTGDLALCSRQLTNRTTRRWLARTAHDMPLGQCSLKCGGSGLPPAQPIDNSPLLSEFILEAHDPAIKRLSVNLQFGDIIDKLIPLIIGAIRSTIREATPGGIIGPAHARHERQDGDKNDPRTYSHAGVFKN
jgi:hypothetical protein